MVRKSSYLKEQACLFWVFLLLILHVFAVVTAMFYTGKSNDVNILVRRDCLK